MYFLNTLFQLGEVLRNIFHWINNGLTEIIAWVSVTIVFSIVINLMLGFPNSLTEIETVLEIEEEPLPLPPSLPPPPPPPSPPLPPPPPPSPRNYKEERGEFDFRFKRHPYYEKVTKAVSHWRNAITDPDTPKKYLLCPSYYGICVAFITYFLYIFIFY